jgi:peptide/nickel transport system substrate-binding protein
MRKFVVLVTFAILVSACTSPQSTSPQSSQTPQPTTAASAATLVPLIKGIWSSELVPDYVDPHRQTAPHFIHMWKAVAEPLVEVYPGTPGLQGVLAASWDVTDQGKTITFKLRPNVKFTDGTDFDAAAAKFNLDRQKSLNAGSAYVLAEVNSVEVVDPLTVRINQRSQFAPILAGLALIGMMSPKSIKDNQVAGDQGIAYTKRNIIGTGPYKLVKYDFPNSIELERNAAYWKGWQGSHAERFILDISTVETQNEQLFLQRGDVDFVLNVPTDNIATLQGDKNITVLTSPASTTWIAKLQLEAGPTKDVRVRRALNYLWNFEAYKKVAGGLASPADGPFATGLIAPSKPTNPYSYDPQKAKQLLSDANVAPGTKFTWYRFTGNFESRLISEIMQIELQKLGYQVEIIEAPFDAVVSAWNNFHGTPTGSIPSASNIFLQPRYADPYSVAYLFYACALRGSTAGRNYNYYCNPEVDRLIAEAATTGDTVHANDLYAQAGRLIADDAPEIYIAKRVEVRALRCNLKGWQLHQIYFEYINLYNLYKTTSC